MEGDLMFHVGT
jgi:hypothetical protein